MQQDHAEYKMVKKEANILVAVERARAAPDQYQTRECEKVICRWATSRDQIT